MLEKLLLLLAAIRAGEIDAVDALKRLLWSAAVAFVIALTPTKTDDEVLATLRSLFPQ